MGDDERIDRPHYRIEFLPGAARQLEKLPITGRTLVAVAIDDLSEEPRPAGAKLLSGTSGKRSLGRAKLRVLGHAVPDEQADLPRRDPRNP